MIITQLPHELTVDTIEINGTQQQIQAASHWQCIVSTMRHAFFHQQQLPNYNKISHSMLQTQVTETTLQVFLSSSRCSSSL